MAPLGYSLHEGIVSIWNLRISNELSLRLYRGRIPFWDLHTLTKTWCSLRYTHTWENLETLFCQLNKKKKWSANEQNETTLSYLCISSICQMIQTSFEFPLTLVCEQIDRVNNRDYGHSTNLRWFIVSIEVIVHRRHL